MAKKKRAEIAGPKLKLPASLRASLKRILEYSWDDELRSAAEYLAENGSLEGHIFNDLVVGQFLYGWKKTVRQYVEADQ